MVPPPCAIDADCPEGLHCVEGQCMMPPPCAIDEDCPEGLSCVEGQCVMVPPPCAIDADCPENQICEEGICVEAPQNSCALSIPIDHFGRYFGDTRGTLTEQRGSCAGNGPEQVFSLSVDEPIMLCINTVQTNFDTVLYARTDCMDPNSEIVCNDDDDRFETRSAIEINAEVGVEYSIFMDGYSRGGEFIMDVTPGSCEVICGNNDMCGEGQVCIESQCRQSRCAHHEECPEGSLCGGVCAEGQACEEIPIPLDHFGIYEGSTIAAPDVLDGACHGNGPEQVFTLSSDISELYCLHTAGSSYDTVLHVLQDCADPQSQVICNDDGSPLGTRSFIELEVEAGLLYFIYMDGYSGGGDYLLHLLPGACEGICDSNEDCADGMLCQNFQCIVPECLENTDCPEGLLCAEGACVVPGCEVNEQCAEGHFCIEGFCQEIACESLEDCPEGFACNGGLCAIPECVEDLNCGEGMRCFEGFCQDLRCEVNADCPGGLVCNGGLCIEPPVWSCERPHLIPGPGSYEGEIVGQDSLHRGCAGNGPEDVYVIPPAGMAGIFCLDTFGSGYDTVLYARAACEDPNSQLICDDDTGGRQSQIQLNVEMGRPYFVFVDAYNAGVSGGYILNVNPGPCF